MANNFVTIPAGKRVVFKSNGAFLAGLENIDVILEEDVTVVLNSSFQSLVGGGSSRALTLLGGLLRDTSGFGFSGQFKELGFQMWTGTDPIGVNITVGFYMKNNAFDDVVRPTHALIKLPLPIDAGTEEGQSGFGLIPPGPSVLEALNSGEESARRGKNISCRIGYIWLPNVIVNNAEPTFSNECDENGYPIWSKIRLSIQTLFTATTSMIDRFGFGE